MTLYRVMQKKSDENSLDQVITDWITLEKAKEFIDYWVSDRSKQYGIPCSEENISALSNQLYYETKEMNLEVELSRQVVSNIKDFLEDNTESKRSTLELGYGNSEYIKKGIEENTMILDALHCAAELGLKAKIVFEENKGETNEEHR